MIRLTFACGHAFSIDAAVSDAPLCPACGERRVSRVTAPPPKFVGCCQGPSAEQKALEGLPIGIPKELTHG